MCLRVVPPVKNQLPGHTRAALKVLLADRGEIQRRGQIDSDRFQLPHNLLVLNSADGNHATRSHRYTRLPVQVFLELRVLETRNSLHQVFEGNLKTFGEL